MDDAWWKKARKVSVELFHHCLFLLFTSIHVAFFQDILGCGKFKKQGLQNIEKLQICFGSITNIGIDHCSPHIATTATNIEQGDT
jgi:hypothetical protein